MAGPSQQPQAVSAFPLPPDLYRQYTEENLASGRVLPPPPPIQGHFVVFGEEYNTEDEMIRVSVQAYPV